MSGDAQDDQLVASWRDIASAVERTQRGIGQALEESGVSAQEFAVLSFLLHADDHRAPMNVLAREVSMTSGGFTKLADRMARDGLIDRRGSDEDRRVIRAVLTPDGESRVRRAAGRYVEILRGQVLATLSLGELSAIGAALRALSPPGGEPVEPAEADVPAPSDRPRVERRGRPAPGT